MTWNPLPHGPLEKLEDNLWCVQGSLPRMALARRMSVVRLADGRLVIHSAIALREDVMQELEAWGEPAFIVVPGKFHRLDAPGYAERYPHARVLCPAAARSAVAQLTEVHGSVDELPPGPALSVFHPSGIRDAEVVLQVRHVDGDATLVFNDLIFNLPHQPGFGGFMLRMLGSSGGPRVTRVARWTMVKDAAALRESLVQLAETPKLARLVMSHGDVIDRDAPGALRHIAQGL